MTQNETDTFTDTLTVSPDAPAQSAADTAMASIPGPTQAGMDDSDLLEKTEPGVYVRNRRAADELDYLWGKEKHKERDPSRFLSFYFVAGIAIGILVGISSTLFMVYKTEWMPANRAVVTPGGPIIEEHLGSDESTKEAGGLLDKNIIPPTPADTDDLQKPENFVTIIQDEAKANKPTNKPTNKPATEPAKPAPVKPTATTTPTATTQPKPSATAGIEVKTHTIKPGDTLGALAEKYYGSIAPKYVEKIQRANNISDPSALHLGQKLVIPPKNY